MDDHRRQMLNEQYEEAALALLMDEWAESDGSRLWAAFEEARSQGNTPDMPDALDRQCKSLAEHTFRKRARSAKWKSACKKALKAAVITLALLAVTSKIFLSVDAIRIPVLNFILEKRAHFSQIKFMGSDYSQSSEEESYLDIMNATVPSGYSLCEDKWITENYGSIVFENDAGEVITFESLPASGTIIIDTEDAECYELCINGYNAMMVEKDGFTLYWHSDDNSILYFLRASEEDMDIHDFLTIASLLAAR